MGGLLIDIPDWWSDQSIQTSHFITCTLLH